MSSADQVRAEVPTSGDVYVTHAGAAGALQGQALNALSVEILLCVAVELFGAVTLAFCFGILCVN